jgi:hypothetical protein
MCVKVVQHVLEVGLLPNVHLLSALEHLGVGIQAELLLVQGIQDIVLISHAHLDISFLEDELLEVYMTSGWVCLDQLEVLGQAQANVLIQVVIDSVDEGELKEPGGSRLILVLGLRHQLLLSREEVGCQRKKLALRHTPPERFHDHLHLLSAAIVQHDFQFCLS